MFLKSAQLNWIATCVLLGCAAPNHPPVASPRTATVSAEGRLSLEVLVLKPEGGTRSLGREDSLHAGDNYNLRIVSDRPAYLNVVLMGSSGQRTLLAQQSASRPGIPTVLPENDVLTLAKEEQARVFVIASPAPLNAAQVQEQIAQAREASAEDVRDPPPTAGPENRPGERSKLQLASFSRDGVAALWFALTR